MGRDPFWGRETNWLDKSRKFLRTSQKLLRTSQKRETNWLDKSRKFLRTSQENEKLAFQSWVHKTYSAVA